MGTPSPAGVGGRERFKTILAVFGVALGGDMADGVATVGAAVMEFAIPPVLARLLLDVLSFSLTGGALPPTGFDILEADG